MTFPERESSITRRKFRPITRRAALRLILEGTIARAIFLNRGRKRLLRYLERHGIRTTLEGGGKLLQVYRFEVMPTAEPEGSGSRQSTVFSAPSEPDAASLIEDE